jgi:hypothetical protein
MAIVTEELFCVPGEKFAASCANNFDLPPFPFAVSTAEFESAHGATHGTCIEIFLYFALGRKSFLFQYLENTLFRDVGFLGYLGHSHE